MVYLKSGIFCAMQLTEEIQAVTNNGNVIGYSEIQTRNAAFIILNNGDSLLPYCFDSPPE